MGGDSTKQRQLVGAIMAFTSAGKRARLEWRLDVGLPLPQPAHSRLRFANAAGEDVTFLFLHAGEGGCPSTGVALALWLADELEDAAQCGASYDAESATAVLQGLPPPAIGPPLPGGVGAGGRRPSIPSFASPRHAAAGGAGGPGGDHAAAAQLSEPPPLLGFNGGRPLPMCSSETYDPTYFTQAQRVPGAEAVPGHARIRDTYAHCYSQFLRPSPFAYRRAVGAAAAAVRSAVLSAAPEAAICRAVEGLLEAFVRGGAPDAPPRGRRGSDARAPGAPPAKAAPAEPLGDWAAALMSPGGARGGHGGGGGGGGGAFLSPTAASRVRASNRRGSASSVASADGDAAAPAPPRPVHRRLLLVLDGLDAVAAADKSSGVLHGSAAAPATIVASQRPRRRSSVMLDPAMIHLISRGVPVPMTAASAEADADGDGGGGPGAAAATVQRTKSPPPVARGARKSAAAASAAAVASAAAAAVSAAADAGGSSHSSSLRHAVPGPLWFLPNKLPDCVSLIMSASSTGPLHAALAERGWLGTGPLPAPPKPKQPPHHHAHQAAGTPAPVLRPVPQSSSSGGKVGGAGAAAAAVAPPPSTHGGGGSGFGMRRAPRATPASPPPVDPAAEARAAAEARREEALYKEALRATRLCNDAFVPEVRRREG